MELKYIRTEKYKILENLDLNFSHKGKHRFEYRDKKLIVNTNTPHVLEFGKNINSVTAIAGLNGSGKSTICELILEISASFRDINKEFPAQFKGIVCLGQFIAYYKDIQILKKIQ